MRRFDNLERDPAQNRIQLLLIAQGMRWPACPPLAALQKI
jgi:hypothetical protein